MNKTSLISMLTLLILTNTACVSTSIKDSIAEIELESNRSVNQDVLSSIQALRLSHKVIEQEYTFTYQAHNKELHFDDKIQLSHHLIKQGNAITVNIAPAKAETKIHQVALSMERAKILRVYLSHFYQKVTINFAPKLTRDTIIVSTGA